MYEYGDNRQGMLSAHKVKVSRDFDFRVNSQKGLRTHW